MKLLYLLLPLLAAGPALAQTAGCPDPQATNYTPGATVNDGSCQYPATSTPLPAKAALSPELNESSGLQLLGTQLWSHNDSGNAPLLYRVDTTSGQTLQRVRLSNTANIDWEDLAADANYLYVGDFGNNPGTRRDLRVLRVPRAALGPGADSARAQGIYFRYPDQTDFTPRNNRHNFDCEAFFVAHDSLHLFTKDWQDYQTRYYTVPATPGTYVAHLKATFNVNGLVTAADLSPGGTAALLGYDPRNGAAFVWLLWNGRGTAYFGGNKRRIELPSVLQVGQVEGLAFTGRNRLLVSNERLATPLVTVPAQLYGLSIGRWINGGAALATTPARNDDVGIVATPNPARQRLHLARAGGVGPAALSIVSLQGQEVLAESLPAATQQLDVDLAGLEPGVYVLKLRLGSRTHTQKLVVP